MSDLWRVHEDEIATQVRETLDDMYGGRWEMRVKHAEIVGGVSEPAEMVVDVVFTGLQ